MNLLPLAFTADQRHMLGLVLLYLAALAILALTMHHLIVGRPAGRTWRQHFRGRWHYHLLSLGAGVVGWLLLVGVIGGAVYLYLHPTGALFDRHRHIAPPPRARTAGVSPSYVSPDLSAYLGGRVDDQLQTNSCCGWALIHMDEINRGRRGENVAGRPMSGFKPWYYASGGQNVGTTVESERDALNAHGLEPLAQWPAGGYPAPSDAAYTTDAQPTQIHYDYYLDAGGGRAGLDDVEAHLSRGEPMGLVWLVHHDGMYATTDFTEDGGAEIGYHCLVAVQWAANFEGHGEAVKLLNQWGRGWSDGSGTIWMSATAFEVNVKGAWTETPGAPVPAWLPTPTPKPRPTAVPTATATPRPTARPTSTPRPTATATPRPRPTATPAPVERTVLRSTNARQSPAKTARIVAGLPAGSRVEDLRQRTPHWEAIVIISGGRHAWVPRHALFANE